MNFKENNRPIYLQIADRISYDIMNGTYRPDDRLPSVREYAASVEVNANTVMRTYDYLSSKDIIYNKRGIGFFVSLDAKDNIVTLRRRTFLEEDITDFFKELEILGISPSELSEMYAKYLNSTHSNQHLQ